MGSARGYRLRKGIFKVGFRVCACRAGHYFVSLSPNMLDRVGGGAGGSWREKGGNLPLVVWVRFLEGLLKSDRC